MILLREGISPKRGVSQIVLIADREKRERQKRQLHLRNHGVSRAGSIPTRCLKMLQ
jgi:hypothetical protein